MSTELITVNLENFMNELVVISGKTSLEESVQRGVEIDVIYDKFCLKNSPEKFLEACTNTFD